MIMLDVKVVGLNDPPPWPEITDCTPGNLEKVGGLQNGTQNGQTTLYFIIKTPTGHVSGQTTLALLDTLHAIAHGADKRFKEQPSRN